MAARTLSLFAISLFLITPTLAEEKPATPEADARKDLQAMQGTWQMESHVDAKKTKIDVKKRKLFIGAELFLTRDGDKMLQAGVIRLVTGKSPRRIDVVVRKGQHEDNTMLGIYEVKGDTLKLCFDPEGEGRPAAFEAKPDTARYVAVYKRVKPSSEAIDICGKYTSTTFGSDGKQQRINSEIEKRGDAYMVKWTVPGGVAYLGIGIRKGDTFSVTWANRGTVGLSVYRIEKGPKLVGEFTELGGVGAMGREELTPSKGDQVEVRLRK
jgi:uncharacterized protein (TIGR03067 family)